MSATQAKKAVMNHNFFQHNEKELRLDYPDHYIAIADEEVIAAETSHDELVDKIESKEQPMEDVLVKYVRTGSKKVIK